MNKKQQQSEDTKQRILEVACELFAKKGYNSASVEEMAAASSCSKANIYYHFKSKEELFLHIAALHEKQWYEMWSEQRSNYPTITEQLFGVIEFSIRHGLAHPLQKATCEFMADNAKASEVVCEVIAAKIAKNRQFYEELFEDGIANGEFRAGSAQQYSIVFEGMLRGIGETTNGMDPWEALELYRAAIQLLLHGIAKDR
ncbi:TetR/AcrR family transcriptional regulator [Paenibacillus sp. strain BS8-2]